MARNGAISKKMYSKHQIHGDTLEKNLIRVFVSATSRGNPGTSSMAFCISNRSRDFIYIEANEIPVGDNLFVEAKAIMA